HGAFCSYRCQSFVQQGNWQTATYRQLFRKGANGARPVAIVSTQRQWQAHHDVGDLVRGDDILDFAEWDALADATDESGKGLRYNAGRIDDGHSDATFTEVNGE